MTALHNPGILAGIDSAAQNGESVQRRRFQKGSVFLNQSRTMWVGQYSEYVLDARGVEVRNRPTVILCPATGGKRAAMRALQPHLDRVNNSLASPAQERKSAALADFLVIWRRDYLALSKPSTQSSVKANLNRLETALGAMDMRKIDAGDVQRIISAMNSDNLNPKTIRNLWGTVSLIWQAALAQKYVDCLLPKPKLPKLKKKTPKFFTLAEAAALIANSDGEYKRFYWLAAETGLRAGELAGLKLTDIGGTCLSVNQTVWHGQAQSPKTENALRTLALSPELVTLLHQQIAAQKAKGHEYLFTSSTGSPWDMNLFRGRKLTKHLEALGIEQRGLHALRHFNVSILDSLRVPLKTIQERIGHALTGSFTLDVYGHALDWNANVEAARRVGETIAEKVLTATLTAKQKKSSQDLHLEAAVA